MMRKILISAILTAGLAACATSPAEQAQMADQQARADAKVSEALAGLVPGQPTDCVSSYEIRNASTQTYGNVQLYRVSSSLIYRNDTSAGCFGLEHGDALISRTPTDQLCRGDILESRDLRAGNITTGSCTRGEWVKYTR